LREGRLKAEECSLIPRGAYAEAKTLCPALGGTSVVTELRSPKKRSATSSAGSRPGSC